jgi:hypothetical protein
LTAVFFGPALGGAVASLVARFAAHLFFIACASLRRPASVRRTCRFVSTGVDVLSAGVAGGRPRLRVCASTPGGRPRRFGSALPLT